MVSSAKNSRSRRLVLRLATIATIGALGALVLASCVGDDPTTTPTSGNDAGGPATDAAAAPDTAAVDASVADGADAASPPCDLQKPFATPTPVPGVVNTANVDDGFWLLPDQLVAYISTDRPTDAGAGNYIYSVRRPTPTAPWGTLTLEPSLASGTGRGPVLTADGLTIYFFRGGGGSDLELWTSTRASTLVPFPAPAAAAAPLNAGASNNDAPSWVSPDGTVLLLASNRGGNGDVYRAVRGAGGFGTPELVPSLNSPGTDIAIFTPDELQAFVSSDRDSAGHFDIYYATRPSTAVGFSVPTLLTNVNAPALVVDDTPMWVSPDGCTLYTRRNPGTVGKQDIYVTRRPP